MELYKTFSKECSKLNVRTKNKEETLRLLAKQASKSELVKDFTEEEIFQKLKAREEEGTTGFGDEVAIPHARLEGMKDFLLFIVTSVRGVDFESLDKKRVKLLFIILGPPDRVNDHLKILAAVSRLAARSTVKNEFIRSSTVSALFESFVRNTQAEEAVIKEKEKMKLMLINLYIDEYLYSILEFFIQEGVEGATIIDSSGMGEYISNIPLFAEFIGFMQKNKNQSKTIFVMVPESRISEIIRGIENITGDLDKKQGAMVVVLDISFYKGNMKMV